MPHEQGAYLGSVRSVEDLRGRCVCDAHTGCWQLRTARGRVMREDRTPVLWVFGHGKLSSARAAYFLANGRMPQHKMIAYRTCDTRDCVNPAHIKATPRAVYARKHIAIRPGEASVAQREALRRGYSKRMVLTPELKAWLIESSQSHGAAAHGIGICASRVSQIRRAAVPSNVFMLAGRSPRLVPANERRAAVAA